MIRNSIKIFLIGFISGTIASSILVLLFPGIYYAFLELLGRKIEAQASITKSMSLAIILNNLAASFLCSYGGFVDRTIASIPDERLRYYLPLYIFPTFILVLNGFVLGAFFIFYLQNLEKYYGGLFPHAYFELGEVQERAQRSGKGQDFKVLPCRCSARDWRDCGVVVKCRLSIGQIKRKP